MSGISLGQYNTNSGGQSNFIPGLFITSNFVIFFTQAFIAILVIVGAYNVIIIFKKIINMYF